MSYLEHLFSLDGKVAVAIGAGGQVWRGRCTGVAASRWRALGRSAPVRILPIGEGKRKEHFKPNM